MALTNGAVNQDLVKLENKNRIKKTFPFQDFEDYSPVGSDGESQISQ